MGHRLRSLVRVTTIRVDKPKSLLQSAGVSLLTDRMRSGTYWMQANWQVTVEGKSSVNKLAGVFPSQSTTVQEDAATSSTDVAEPVTDYTEGYKTTKESVSVEQGQQLRAAKPGQCVLKVKTRRQRDTVEFTHSLQGVYGKDADDLYRRQQDSDLEDASLDRIDVAAEIEMDRVLVSYDRGSVTAVTEPKDVTEYMVRVSGSRFETWELEVFSLTCQNEPGESTLQNNVDQARLVKTIPRNTPRYSHDSLGQCESSM